MIRTPAARSSVRPSFFRRCSATQSSPLRVKAVIGGEALQRSLLGRAEGEVGGVLHLGGLSGRCRALQCGGLAQAPALASREALRGLPLFGIAGFSGAFNAVWRSRVALGV